MSDICIGQVVCSGTYGGHLQGITTDNTNIYWSFTTSLVKTDAKVHIYKGGRRIKSITPEEYNSYKPEKGETTNMDDFIDQLQEQIFRTCLKKILEKNSLQYDIQRFLEELTLKIELGESYETRIFYRSYK